jgi:Tyrosyl-DNA phosphodiesterase
MMACVEEDNRPWRLPLGTFADGQSIYRNQLREEQGQFLQSSPDASSSAPCPSSSCDDDDADRSRVAIADAADHSASLERSSTAKQQQQQQRQQQQHHGINIMRHRNHHQQESSLNDDDDDMNEESFQDGHVHISHLVLPETTSALLTSFGSPEFAWLESWLGNVPQVLLVHQGHGVETERSHHLNEIGTATLCPLPLPRVVAVSSNDNDNGGGDGNTTSKENQTTSASAQSGSNNNSSSNSSPPSPTKKQSKKSSSRPHWHQMFVKPHMGLMHSKLCLFRNQHGLRVVICGANLFQNQWECQRDVLWIQDFFNTTVTVTTSTSATSKTSINNVNKSNQFGDAMYKFCRDLTICASADDQGVVDKFLYLILGFNNELDFTTAAGTIVYSFPRRQDTTRNSHDSSPCTHRGGWKMLAESVQEQFILQRQRDKDRHHMPVTIADVVLGLKERHDRGGVNNNNTMKRKRRQGSTSSTADVMITTHIKTIHVMSGSLGDVKPGFLEQMKNALRGLQEPAGSRSRTTSWDVIVADSNNSPSNSSNSSAVGWQIYWPSQETAAKSMMMQSIRANMRAIPKAYWQTIPPTARQALFADVVHNPLKASGMTGGHCYPNSHAKVILSLAPLSPQNSRRRKRDYNDVDDDDDDDEYDDDYSDDEMDESSLYNILYVGSHNFSISAWGLNDTPPKNVELGIVLTTSLREIRREWVQRLPYKLSSSSSRSSSAIGGCCCFASDANYVPASGWEEETTDNVVA